MRFDLLINGVSLLRETGFAVVNRPKIPTTKRKFIAVGNGDEYSAVGNEDNVIPVELNCLDNTNISSKVRNLYKFLGNSQELVFSDDKEVFYKVKKVVSDDFESTLGVIGKGTVEFTLAPGAYLKSGKTKIVVTENTTIENLYDESEPVITVFGQGLIDVVIAQQVIKLKNIEGSITLDTPILEAYKGSELANSKVNGEFPLLPPGVFSVTWSGNVSRIEIVPNWRWS